MTGMSPTNPWVSTSYPDAASSFDPTYYTGDTWKVTAIVNGVESQVPAYSSAATANCQPSVS